MATRKEQIKLLGRLLDKQEKIDAEIKGLYASLGLMAVGSDPATPSVAPSPQQAEPAGPPASPSVVEGREKQGRYMAALRGLGAEQRILVKQARDKEGVDYAIDYAKGLKEGVYASAGTATESEELSAGELLDSI